jgi:hypothetical protein
MPDVPYPGIIRVSFGKFIDDKIEYIGHSDRGSEKIPGRAFLGGEQFIYNVAGAKKNRRGCKPAVLK